MIEEKLLIKLNSFFTNFTLHHYKKRTPILNANDSASSVFYLKEGFIRVYRISDEGEELTLTILKPHDFFPLTYGMTSKSNHYFLEAITPIALWKAPVEQFISYIKANPDIYYELTGRILIRFDGVLTRMEFLVFSNASTKVAATLLLCAKSLGKEVGEDMIITVPLTHKDIATLVGVTRETTSLEMKKLEKRGFLKKQHGQIIIRSWKKLESELSQYRDDTTLVDSI